MIADYLYNTPAPPAGSTVAVVLFATAYADSESLNAVVHGKTLTQIVANSNTLAAGESKKTPVTFGGSGKRKKSSLYGRTYAPEFEFPTSVDFTVHRNGIARAVFFGLIVGGKIVRGIHMTVALSGAEAKTSRASFSVDDDFVSAIEGPAFVGQPIGDVLTTVIHAQMAMAPSLIGLPVTEDMVHLPFTSLATITPPTTDANVVHAPMQMVATPTTSTIDKSTIRAEFRPAVASEYKLSADERSLTKIGALNTSSRSFEVTGKPRPNTKCFMRVRFNGSPYPVIAISNGLITASNQVAWTLGSLAANVWHEVKVEHVSGDTYKYSVNGSVLYTGTATNLTFYSHTNVTLTEIDTGQLGTALPAGFVWL